MGWATGFKPFAYGQVKTNHRHMRGGGRGRGPHPVHQRQSDVRRRVGEQRRRAQGVHQERLQLTDLGVAN